MQDGEAIFQSKDVKTGALSYVYLFALLTFLNAVYKIQI